MQLHGQCDHIQQLCIIRRYGRDTLQLHASQQRLLRRDGRRYDGRGNKNYHWRYALQAYPVETPGAAAGGRLERFRADVLKKIALEGGNDADGVFLYYPTYTASDDDDANTPHPAGRLSLSRQN